MKIHNLVFVYGLISGFSPACHCFDLHFEPFSHVLWIWQLCLIFECWVMCFACTELTALDKTGINRAQVALLALLFSPASLCLKTDSFKEIGFHSFLVWLSTVKHKSFCACISKEDSSQKWQSTWKKKTWKGCCYISVRYYIGSLQKLLYMPALCDEKTHISFWIICWKSSPISATAFKSHSHFHYLVSYWVTK